MKNVVKRMSILVVALIVFITLSCSTASAAFCLFGHTAVANPTVDATCTENGSYGGTYCSKCGTVLEAPTVVPAKGHTPSEVPTIVPATTELYGECSYACIDCNMVVNSVIIQKIDAESIKLIATEYVYNGKVVTPKAEVKDADGKVLVENQDYTLAYSEGRKNPGKYTATITFIGNYQGTAELSFTIVPKATSGLKSTAQTTSSISLTWSKVTGATGYQVYKYNSSTKKYEKIKSLKSNSYKVTGLSDSTTYKFKVRAYTKLDDGTVLYGAYSSVYSAKTKVAVGVKFTESSSTIYVGASKTIKATTYPADKKLTWKSSDTSVAKVSSSGKVTAVKSGTATITASFKYKDKTYKATYKITVKKPSVTLSETTATIIESNRLTLIATTDPANLEVTWKSSNTSVATVSSTGIVAAKAEGTATITASIVYKGKTYKNTCKITVNHIPTVEDNIATLVNYIMENGTKNENDIYNIQYVEVTSDYTQTLYMSYKARENALVFSRKLRPAGREYIEVVVSATFYIDRDSVYYGALFTYYNSSGRAVYQAFAEDTIRTFDYIDEYSLYDRWTLNTFPSSVDLSELVFTSTKVSMTNWDVMIHNAVGFGLKDIGFTNYRR